MQSEKGPAFPPKAEYPKSSAGAIRRNLRRIRASADPHCLLSPTSAEALSLTGDS